MSNVLIDRDESEYTAEDPFAPFTRPGVHNPPIPADIAEMLRRWRSVGMWGYVVERLDFEMRPFYRLEHVKTTVIEEQSR